MEGAAETAMEGAGKEVFDGRGIVRCTRVLVFRGSAQPRFVNGDIVRTRMREPQCPGARSGEEGVKIGCA